MRGLRRPIPILVLVAVVLAAAGTAIGLWATRTHSPLVVAQYEAVSCTSTSKCFATGYLGLDQSNPALLQLGGAGPVVLSSLGTPGAVSCSRGGSCLWVGALRHGRRLVAAALSIRGSRVIPVSSDPTLELGGPQELFCLPRSCVELGEMRNSTVEGAAWWSWGDDAWAPARRVPVPSFVESLTSVSCTSSICMAVGHGPSSGSASISVLERHGGWQKVHLPASSGAALSSVSCATNRYCMAVGSNTAGSPPHPEAMIWNGTIWRVLPTAGLTPQGSFFAVSCPAVEQCIAVGTGVTSSRPEIFSPLVWRWDGATWSNLGGPLVLHHAPRAGILIARGSYLTAISCIDPVHCVASGSSISASGPAVLVGSKDSGWHEIRVAG